jgi:hypothetical protein
MKTRFYPMKAISPCQGRAGGNRTHKVSPPEDFKSPASASSATAPRCNILKGPESGVKCWIADYSELSIGSYLLAPDSPTGSEVNKRGREMGLGARQGQYQT